MWHLWMDPQRLADRSGPFTLLLLLVLFASPTQIHATLSRGHPSKDVRTIQSAISAGANSEVESSSVAVGETDLPGAETVRGAENSQLESATWRASDERASRGPDTREESSEIPSLRQKSSARNWEQETTSIAELIAFNEESAVGLAPALRKVGGYLPEVGPAPLRFAAARRWPAAMTRPEQESAVEEIVELPPMLAATPQPDPVEDEAPAEASKPKSTDVGLLIDDMLNNHHSTVRRTLAPDVVVGRLNTLLRRSTDLPVRFQPAVVESPAADILSDPVR